MSELHDGRGILYPTRLPTFHREPAPEAVTNLVRWFWIPRWHLAPGRTSRQNILPFPACNLIVSPERVELVGPSLGASYRDLTGNGWAVGALLRPAAAACLVADLPGFVNRSINFSAPELLHSIRGTMTAREPDQARQDAVRVFSQWVLGQLPAPDQPGLMANRMEDLIATDSSLVRLEQLADQLRISKRAVQRLARKYVGVSPTAMIRRYRLQEAAQRLRTDPHTTIADIAAELGYTDHAHLTADFRRTLGFTPKAYRESD